MFLYFKNICFKARKVCGLFLILKAIYLHCINKQTHTHTTKKVKTNYLKFYSPEKTTINIMWHGLCTERKIQIRYHALYILRGLGLSLLGTTLLSVSPYHDASAPRDSS